MCCGWRKLDFCEKRKKYMIRLFNNKVLCLREYEKHKRRGHFSGGENVLVLYLFEKEKFDLIITRQIKDILKKRTMYIPQEVALQLLYEQKPELFEDD